MGALFGRRRRESSCGFFAAAADLHAGQLLKSRRGIDRGRPLGGPSGRGSAGHKKPGRSRVLGMGDGMPGHANRPGLSTALNCTSDGAVRVTRSGSDSR